MKQRIDPSHPKDIMRHVNHLQTDMKKQIYLLTYMVHDTTLKDTFEERYQQIKGIL